MTITSDLCCVRGLIENLQREGSDSFVYKLHVMTHNKSLALILVHRARAQKTKTDVLPWLAAATVLSHRTSHQSDMPEEGRLAPTMTSGCVLLCFSKPYSRAANSAEHAPPKTGTEPVGTSCLRWISWRKTRRASGESLCDRRHRRLCSSANRAVCFLRSVCF